MSLERKPEHHRRDLQNTSRRADHKEDRAGSTARAVLGYPSAAISNVTTVEGMDILPVTVHSKAMKDQWKQRDMVTGCVSCNVLLTYEYYYERITGRIMLIVDRKVLMLKVDFVYFSVIRTVYYYH